LSSTQFAKASPLSAEAEEDRRAVLVPVSPGLFLGNASAARDPDLLAREGITQCLNLAVNLDMAPVGLADGTAIRHAKIGLIDGAGNHPLHLVAAALTIGAMREQSAPGKPSYPDHRPGHLLVHCRGGRSRSVAALALNLAWSDPVRFESPDAALHDLRKRRGLPETQPNAAMCKLIDEAWLVMSSLKTA
jgi:rhodanese-related sulfurtransferase